MRRQLGAAPTNAADAVTKAYVDGLATSFVDASGNPLTGRRLVVVINTTTGAIIDIQSSTGPDAVAPTVPGTPVATAGVGQISLTWAASTDNVSVSSYRIYRSDAPTTIKATSSGPSYTDTTAVVGTPYTYTVDAIDATGNASAKSAASNSVAATAPPVPALTNTTAPTISGSPVEGQVLTVTPGTYSATPDSYTYQWKRGGSNISGATGTTYTLVSADVGSSITVTETVAKSGYTGTSATSAATATVTPVGGTALNNTVAPAITGSAVTGQTLTVSNGTWSATPDSYTYQWKRAGVDISGATAAMYVLQVADVGQAITATVTAVKSGYTSGSATSNSVTPSAPSSGTVFVSDTFTEASTVLLTAHTGEVGASWTIHPNFTGGGAAVSGSRVRSNGTVTSVFYASGVPSSADYSAEIDFAPQTTQTGILAGLAIRVNPTASTWYVLQYTVSTGLWELRRIGGTGGSTTLQSVAQALTPGQTYRAKISAVGTTLTAYVDGAQILTATDANHTAAGRVGVTFGGTPASTVSTGLHLDNLVATS